MSNIATIKKPFIDTIGSDSPPPNYILVDFECIGTWHWHQINKIVSKLHGNTAKYSSLNFEALCHQVPNNETCRSLINVNEEWRWLCQQCDASRILEDDPNFDFETLGAPTNSSKRGRPFEVGALVSHWEGWSTLRSSVSCSLIRALQVRFVRSDSCALIRSIRSLPSSTCAQIHSCSHFQVRAILSSQERARSRLRCVLSGS